MQSTAKGSVRSTVIKTLERIGRGSCAEIERKGQMAEGASRATLRDMRLENKARVCEWARNSPKSSPYAVWELGSEPDAPRPVALGRGYARANIPKQDPFEPPARTEPLPMDYPIKSVFAGGVSPWAGMSVSS